jgi:hypothetical protein
VLLLLLVWAILLACCLAVGLVVLRVVGGSGLTRPGDCFVLSVWLGLTTMAALLLAAAHFAPLSEVGLPLMIGLSLPALIHPGARRGLLALISRPSAVELAGVLALGAGAAAFTAQYVFWYDTGLYHYSAVRWLSQHGVVPGIALLQPRFGVACSWFALAAAFDFEFLETRACTALNGFALLLGAGHALLCLSRLLRREGAAADWFALTAYALVLPLVILSRMPVSLTPNLPAILLTVLTAWSFLIIETPRGSLIPVLLSLGAASFKLNAAPLALVACAFYLYRSGTGFASLARLGLSSLLMFAPVVAFQILTAGYPFFPLTLAGLPLPWGISPEESRLLSRTVTSWARWQGPAPPDADGVNWIWRGWFPVSAVIKSKLFYLGVLSVAAGVALARVGRARARALGLALAVAGGAALAYIMMFRANNFMMVFLLLSAAASWRRRGWPLLAGVLGMAFVLYMGPDVNFGMGYAAVLWACLAAPAFGVARELAGRAGGRVGLAALLAAAGVTLGLCRYLPSWNVEPPEARQTSFLIAPPRLRRVPTQRARVGGVEFYRPAEGNQCWAEPLPCTSGGAPRDYFHMPDDVGLLNPARGISAGYRREGGRQ